MATQIITHGKVTWTNITRADAADVRRLGEAYPHFHPLNLEDLTSHMERPKIDEYPDHLFVVMQFPLWDAKERISRPGEVDFFVGADYVVTAHDGDLKPLNELFRLCQSDEAAREQFMGKTAGELFHTVIDRLVDYLFPILRKVDENTQKLEENLFIGHMREVIQEISVARRDVIALRRIVRPQVDIIANLGTVDRPFIHEDLEVFFSDTLDHIKKARDFLDEETEVIEGLARTSDTLATYRINEVMRILTVISVIILPLTLLAGCYGMNVRLPGEEHPLVFWVISGAMFLLAVGMLVYFRHRDWL